MKVVAICRVSTDRQEIEAQKNELLSFILNDGVKEEDMIKPEQLLDKIHNKDIRDTCIAKLLRGLFNKCGLHNYYYSNQKH